MKTLKDFNFKNKRVLIRSDFNLPLNEKGEIEDDFRLKQTLPTIEYLIKQGARIILMSHLGEPKGEVVERLRLGPVGEKLSRELNLPAIKTLDCLSKEVRNLTERIKPGEIILLENLRFHKGEQENDLEFAKELAGLSDVYINDAFSVCHRQHASVVGITKYLPSAAGLLLEKEVKILSRILENPWRPLAAVIGGVKIESKIRVIKSFLEKADHLLIAGRIATTILTVKGICLGRPWPSREIVKEIEKFELTSSNLHLPLDALVSPDNKGRVYVRTAAPAKVRKGEELLDIGPETIKIFSQIIKEAKMLVWSGPLGYFEEPKFEEGTKLIAEEISRNHRAFKLAGGGDTISALTKFGLRDKFDHLCTGGGAMLAFFGGQKLPGLEALGYYR